MAKNHYLLVLTITLLSFLFFSPFAFAQQDGWVKQITKADELLGKQEVTLFMYQSGKNGLAFREDYKKYPIVTFFAAGNEDSFALDNVNTDKGFGSINVLVGFYIDDNLIEKETFVGSVSLKNPSLIGFANNQGAKIIEHLLSKGSVRFVAPYKSGGHLDLSVPRVSFAPKQDEAAHNTQQLTSSRNNQLSLSDQAQSQDKGNTLKAVMDSLFNDHMQRLGVTYRNANYQILNDSLAVITFTITAQETRIIRAAIPAVFFVVGQRQGGRVFKYSCLTHERSDYSSGQLFFALEHPYFRKNEMQNSEHRHTLYSRKKYEDALYHRFMTYMAITSLKYGERRDYKEPFMTKEWLESYFHTIKTGLWVSKNEYDAFGDPVGISLSCPFFAKKLNNGSIEKENIEFFLNVSADNIRFIPSDTEYISPYNKYVLTIKDTSGSQITCSLDKDLNVTSNTASFLRVIGKEGIIKGSINIGTNEGGRTSYAFTIYTNGYNAAKSSVNL